MNQIQETIEVLESQIERLKKLQEPDLSADRYLNIWLDENPNNLVHASKVMRKQEAKFAEAYYQWRNHMNFKAIAKEVDGHFYDAIPYMKKHLYSLDDINKAWPAPTPSPLHSEFIEKLTK